MNTKYTQEFIATHSHPALREQADYIFRCRIESNDGVDEWEQMWGKRIAENVFKLCCVPFFVYGISLGDIIKVDENGDTEILERSSNATIRIWTSEANSQNKELFIKMILELCDKAENHSDNLIALSVCKERFADLSIFLEQESAMAGIMFEVSHI